MGVSAQQTRECIGQQARRYQGADRAPRTARHHAAHAGGQPLRLHSARNVFAFMLLLASLRGGTASSAPSTPAATPLLPGPLMAVTNGVVAACTARPRHCLGAIAGGAAVAGVAGLTAAVHHVPTRRADHAIRTRNALSMQVPQIQSPAPGNGPRPDLQHALLDIARRCGTSLACRTDAINALLHTLTATQLRTLLAVRPSTPVAEPRGWPPGAWAAPMWPHASLAALAEELARLYTPEVARLQDDIEAIAAATRRGGTDPVAANVSRLKCIARTLRHDGHQVEQHPFDAADRKLPSRTYRGTNLLVRDPHAPRPTHAATPRLMLVAHGDMTGRGSGSEGAYDNASGVAVLMHVMRQVHADRVPCAGAVDLLVTDLEERHLLGSHHFVEACGSAGDCPTLVINIDMAGRGGHGYVLSGSEALAGHFYLGKGPLHLQQPAISPIETTAIDDLESALGHSGFERHRDYPALVLTSDQLAFQNASIPALGLAQMSAADASHLHERQQAHIAYEQALRAVDWRAWKAHHTGGPLLSDAQVRAHRQAQADIDRAWRRYEHQRDLATRVGVGIIHSGRDRVARVNPRMALDFADALLAYVRQWRGTPLFSPET